MMRRDPQAEAAIKYKYGDGSLGGFIEDNLYVPETNNDYRSDRRARECVRLARNKSMSKDDLTLLEWWLELPVATEERVTDVMHGLMMKNMPAQYGFRWVLR